MPPTNQITACQMTCDLRHLHWRECNLEAQFTKDEAQFKVTLTSTASDSDMRADTTGQQGSAPNESNHSMPDDSPIYGLRHLQNPITALEARTHSHFALRDETHHSAPDDPTAPRSSPPTDEPNSRECDLEAQTQSHALTRTADDHPRYYQLAQSAQMHLRIQLEKPEPDG